MKVPGCPADGPPCVTVPVGINQEEVMSAFSAIGRFAHDYRVARERYLTERQVESLPLEIQKDIGWPDAHRRRTSTIPLGVWAGDR
jgi:hypothetical protein